MNETPAPPAANPPAAEAVNPAPPPAVPSPAKPAGFRGRHYVLALTFLLWVAAPLGVAGVYLYTVALDQYASHVGFAVRKEEGPSTAELLGGLADFTSTSGSADTDILFKYIEGRGMIQAVDAKLNLSQIYVRSEDPVFSLPENATIEDLERFWQRVVKVFYDTRSELIDIRVVAFDAQSAQAINEAIVEESTRVINQLNAIARADTTRYAQDDLNSAIERLKTARQNVTVFRTRTQIVDPRADTQGQLGLINSLQAQLTSALIELDMISETASPSDPRIKQGERRVRVIRDRIEIERERLGSESPTENNTYSELVGEFEKLAVDREFAEKHYLATLATYTSALAEAQRQSRYLATYQPPTLAETAEYPQRGLLLTLLGGALLFSWVIGVLIYYSVRDRR